MIRFFVGIWSTPGATAFREEWRQDKTYRWFVKGCLVTYVVALVFFAYFV